MGKSKRLRFLGGLDRKPERTGTGLRRFYCIWGLQGYKLFFLVSSKHRLWVLIEAVLMYLHNICFELKDEKILQFSSANCHFTAVKIAVNCIGL